MQHSWILLMTGSPLPHKVTHSFFCTALILSSSLNWSEIYHPYLPLLLSTYCLCQDCHILCVNLCVANMYMILATLVWTIFLSLNSILVNVATNSKILASLSLCSYTPISSLLHFEFLWIFKFTSTFWLGIVRMILVNMLDFCKEKWEIEESVCVPARPGPRKLR